MNIEALLREYQVSLLNFTPVTRTAAVPNTFEFRIEVGTPVLQKIARESRMRVVYHLGDSMRVTLVCL